MNGDLVKRLREAGGGGGGPGPGPCNLHYAAADEIERLQQEQKVLIDWMVVATKTMQELRRRNQLLTEKQIASACLSYRHDFGILNQVEQHELMAQAHEWDRLFKRERDDLKEVSDE